MNVQTITDMKELKALAYDQLLLKEQAEHNLQLLNQRIVELERVKRNTSNKESR